MISPVPGAAGHPGGAGLGCPRPAPRPGRAGPNRAGTARGRTCERARDTGRSERAAREPTVRSPPWRLATIRQPGSPSTRVNGGCDHREPAQGPPAAGRSAAQGTRGDRPRRGGPGRPRQRRTRCRHGELVRSARPGAPRVVAGRGLGCPARAGTCHGEGLSLPRMRSGNPSRHAALGRLASADPGANRAQALAPALLGAAQPPCPRNPARPVRAGRPRLAGAARRTPQVPGRTPHSAGRRASGTTHLPGPLRCPGGEDRLSEASEAPAREAINERDQVEHDPAGPA
jgi:hypothetical protein